MENGHRLVLQVTHARGPLRLFALLFGLWAIGAGPLLAQDSTPKPDSIKRPDAAVFQPFTKPVAAERGSYQPTVWLFGPGWVQPLGGPLPADQPLYLGAAGSLPLSVAVVQQCGPEGLLLFEHLSDMAPQTVADLGLAEEPELKPIRLLTHQMQWAEGDLFRRQPESTSSSLSIDWMKECQPEFTGEMVGRFSLYCLWGYGVLQAAVEERTQQPYFQYAAQRLGFGPEMGWLPQPGQDVPRLTAAEGLWATPRAWAQWLADLMQGRFLAADSVQQLYLRPMGPTVNHALGVWSLGFMIYDVRGQKVAVLQATTETSAVLVAYLPGRQWGLVWLADGPPEPDADPRLRLIETVASFSDEPLRQYQWEPLTDSLLYVAQQTAGTYRHLRYPPSGPAHWLSGTALLATITLRNNDDGTLTAHSSLLPGGPVRLRLTTLGQWVNDTTGHLFYTEIAHFQDENETKVILLHTNLFGVSTFVPAPAWTTLGVTTSWGGAIMAYALIAGLIFAIWAAYWWLRRRALRHTDQRYKHVPVSGLGGLQLRVRAAIQGVLLAVHIGIPLALLVDPSLTDTRYAPDTLYTILYILPYTAILLALALWVDVFRQWRKGWFTVTGRLAHTALAVGATVMARALLYWIG